MLSAALIVVFTASMAQPVLKPWIGISPEPIDSDPICAIPYSNPAIMADFQEFQRVVGDTAPDFTLYQLDGTRFNLREKLEECRPVLLVTGSFTCNTFRNRLPDINALFSTYSADIDIYIVYTVEAHPIIDPSPYSALGLTEWSFVPGANDDHQFRQPTIYGERKDLVDSLLNRESISCPILIDGPCNEWWINYGQNAIGAILIGTDGLVYGTNGWFTVTPNANPNSLGAWWMDMYIDTMLANMPPCIPIGKPPPRRLRR